MDGDALIIPREAHVDSRQDQGASSGVNGWALTRMRRASDENPGRTDRTARERLGILYYGGGNGDDESGTEDHQGSMRDLH